jgi:rhodanese-related sulfurtransferase
MKHTSLLSLLCAFILPAVAPLRAQDAKPAKPSTHGTKPPVAKNVKNVGVEEFDKLRASPNSIVLDVRTKKEFDAGHIPGAVNLDINAPDFAARAAKLDQGKTYLVHCAAGVRSAQACNALNKIAVTNLVNLDPGLNAWVKAGKPVEKK